MLSRRKRVGWGGVLLLFSLYAAIPSYAGSAKGVKNQLKEKGLSEEVLRLLTPLCQESLNRRLPEESLWYATFDREARSVTVDFQTPGKMHNSFTVVSLKENGCLTFQNTVLMTPAPCKKEADRWIDSYKKRGIPIRVEEAGEERIALGGEGSLGVKVYLYPMGNLCMQVFRNVETVKPVKK